MAKTLKLNSELWSRVEQRAAADGYSSPEEFVEHLIEQELARLEIAKPESEASKEVERQLRGLGYLE